MKKQISIIIVSVLFINISGMAALESGTYETIFSPTVLEVGDYVPNESRILPRSATLTFDLEATPPQLTAVIHNAVLEGGAYNVELGISEQPFELTVRSSFGELLTDGSYRFKGKYMMDFEFPGLQWWFDWRFSEAGNGIIVWDGVTYWAGGHFWAEIISGITLHANPHTYHAESIFIENPSFEKGLEGWEDGLHGGEVITFSSTPRYGFIDGTNVLRITGHEFDSSYRSQTLEEVVRPNSVYVLEVVCAPWHGETVALQDGSNSTLVEAIAPFNSGEGIYSTIRLIYVVPHRHESIGTPLKIRLGKLPSPYISRWGPDFDNVRLTRYFPSPRLKPKPRGLFKGLNSTNAADASRVSKTEREK